LRGRANSPFRSPPPETKSSRHSSCGIRSSPAEYGTATGADDRDIFDPHCRHLIAVDRSVGRVIGTYRLLEPQAAARIGCLYTESEFWLTRLDGIRPLMVELGRSCVHPDYRNGAAIRLLWAGIGQFLAQHPDLIP
jgi:putative hemolysin